MNVKNIAANNPHPTPHPPPPNVCTHVSLFVETRTIMCFDSLPGKQAVPLVYGDITASGLTLTSTRCLFWGKYTGERMYQNNS